MTAPRLPSPRLSRLSRLSRSSVRAFAAAISASLACAALAVTVAIGASACGGAQRSEDASRDAIVRITCNVPDASLFVDGRFLAPVSLVRGGVALSPGAHRIELRHDAYLGRFLELTLAPAERRTIDAQLFPILP